jgi:hypothetical protein
MYRTQVPLVHEHIQLWQRGEAFPSPGSHTLTVPFTFRLPVNLPPSFHADGAAKSGNITYYLEVVAFRPGLFHPNRRVRAVIAVLPMGTPQVVQLRSQLTSGWGTDMPWISLPYKEPIRSGVWGDYSQVEVTVRPPCSSTVPISQLGVQLRMPDIPAIPFGAPVPIQLDIVTTTKPLKPSDIPDEGDDKPLFPAPPTDATSIELGLHRKVRVEARSPSTAYDTINDNLGNLGGLGRLDGAAQVRVWQDEPQWTAAPEEEHHSKLHFFKRDKEPEERRVCRRASHFATTVVFTCPPTFDVDIIRTTASRQHSRVRSVVAPAHRMV